MWISKTNTNYSARHVGLKMRFFYKEEFVCELRVVRYRKARNMLEDWARLQIPPAQVLDYQNLIKGYVGATVDDVTLGKDGKTYYINGKALEPS